MQGFWAARKGRTTFPFSFKLPQESPSSVSLAGNAAVRYTVKAIVQVWHQDSRTSVWSKADAHVVEQWEDESDARYWQHIYAVAETKLFMGGKGDICAEASLPQQLFLSGSTVTVQLGVRNSSKRDVSGVRIDIVRTVTILESSQVNSPMISEVAHTQSISGPQVSFPSNSELIVRLPLELPGWVRTIRKATLFEVNVTLVIAVQLGTFAKDLEVKLPIYLAHPASVPMICDLQQRTTPSAWPISVPANPVRALPRPHSAMGQHGAYMAAPDYRPTSAALHRPVSVQPLPGMVSGVQYSHEITSQQAQWSQQAEPFSFSPHPSYDDSAPSNPPPIWQASNVAVSHPAGYPSSPGGLERSSSTAADYNSNAIAQTPPQSPANFFSQQPPVNSERPLPVTPSDEPAVQYFNLKTIAEDSEFRNATIKASASAQKSSSTSRDVELLEKLASEPSMDIEPATLATQPVSKPESPASRSLKDVFSSLVPSKALTKEVKQALLMPQTLRSPSSTSLAEPPSPTKVLEPPISPVTSPKKEISAESVVQDQASRTGPGLGLLESRLSADSRSRFLTRASATSDTTKIEATDPVEQWTASKSANTTNVSRPKSEDIDKPEAASQEVEPPSHHLKHTPSSTSESGSRYDVRSARGGRGGKVASVASLWASIADGADGIAPISSNVHKGNVEASGSTIKTLNARPVPRRLHSGETPQLDFTTTGKGSNEASDAKLKAALKKTNVSAGPPKATPLKNVAADPQLHITLPRVSLSAADSPAQRALLRTRPSTAVQELAAIPMSGRGTTRPVGKKRMDELRGMFAQSDL